MPSRGFRWGDVIAVVVLAFVAIGLLLPAIGRVRNSHAAERSANNLKELAMAVHQYCDAHDRKLPPLTDVGTGEPRGAGITSIFFHLLPYVDQGMVYRQFEPEVPESYFAAPNTGRRGAASQVIPTFLDPGDSSAPNGRTNDMTIRLPLAPPAPFSMDFTGQYATTSYAANGLVFRSNRGGLPRTFVDGTSSTIVFSSRPTTCVPPSGKAVHNLWALGTYSPHMPAFATLTPAEPQGLESTGKCAPAGPLSTQRTTAPVQIRIGRSDGPTTTRSYAFQLGDGKTECDPSVLRSPYPSVLLAAMADGQVKRYAIDTTQWVFWAACTPAGHEGIWDWE